MKIPRQLQPLVRDGHIERVVRPLMAGKEAAVYVVVAHGEVCCAKVYKDAEHRSFRNRANYQEGRSVRNSRRARAMQRGTKFGKRELEEDWQNAEVDALYRLAAAGVRVPKPLDFSGGVLLMELIVDDDGNAAPRLNDITLDEETAKAYHQSLLRDVVRMLCVGLVHGDLSEYNVLVDAGGPVIIDLPQAIDAAANNNASRMLQRDVGNLAAYFGRYAHELATTDYGKEIWQLYETGNLTPEVQLTGKYKQPAREANVGSVLEDIADARKDHERRNAHLAPKRAKKKTKDEAWRGVVPEAIADDEADPWAAQLIVSPSGSRKIVDLAPRTAPKPEPKPAETPAKKKRRRRRRGAGGGGGGGQPQSAGTAVAVTSPHGQRPPGSGANTAPKNQAPPATKPRRRRRRRRKAPNPE